MSDITNNSKDFDTAIAELNTKYDAWEKVHVVQNEKLYNMLAETMNVVAQVRAENLELKVEGLLGLRGIKYNKKATLELKVVKLALTDDNKRSSSYARVLTIATTEEITPNNLKYWINKSGGVDSVRRSKATKKTDAKTDYEAAKQSVIEETLNAFFHYEVPNTQPNDLIVFVGRIADDDEIEVIKIAGVGDEDELVKNVISTISKNEKDKKANMPTSQDDDPAMDKLVASATTDVDVDGV